MDQESPSTFRQSVTVLRSRPFRRYMKLSFASGL